ncbi:hypothetical protein NDA13_006423 [Ustilago tritici]|nr:hypothetical protein NDA13_006423 [Ustilago tritici]
MSLQNHNAPKAGSAAAIDNKALHKQVAHLQDKLGKYEDQPTEASLALEKEKEKEYVQKRREKLHEVENSLKNEPKHVKDKLEKAQRASKEQLAELKETRHALQESQLALEHEGAELEGLRANAENFNTLKSGHDGSSTSATQCLQGEKLELETELVQQKQQSEKDSKQYIAAKGTSNTILKLCAPDAETAAQYHKVTNDLASQGFCSLDILAKVLTGDTVTITKKTCKMLQHYGHLTAVTGDDVNDAPSHKKTGCSITIKGASDAANAVSPDEDLSTIITSIEAAVMGTGCAGSKKN